MGGEGVAAPDHSTDLASRLLEAPLAFVTMVDDPGRRAGVFAAAVGAGSTSGLVVLTSALWRVPLFRGCCRLRSRLRR